MSASYQECSLPWMPYTSLFTISIWFYYSVLILRNICSGYYTNYIILYQDYFTMFQIMYTNNNNQNTALSGDLQFNRWYHFALTIQNDTQFTSYVNGTVSQTGTINQHIRTTYIQNTIGGGWYAILAMVQDVIWFPANLNASERESKYVCWFKTGRRVFSRMSPKSKRSFWVK